ncbi:hypothetical protein J2T56_001846 [Natronobacillus azotifigens]|uniref:M14 family metallocarboxypeptidase n=1 Tax=Natronobacillus azotifigens TaxID=472978 RepID=A0A9J6RD90_9BACI|nr:M14 family metallocarboxypeptidase [Natronobacillus azotifigens]MCZ0703690.1 M14 family metallocarboxypeptidase [Natronobacillus azotifigens]
MKRKILIIIFGLLSLIILNTKHSHATSYSADELYNLARNQDHSSSALELYIKGYNQFSADKRFVEGINSSSESLLRWARDQHQNEDYLTAIDRYKLILSAPKVDDLLVRKTEIKLSYAENGNRIPSINTLINMASQEAHSSNRISIYTKAYYLYNNDKRISDGLNKSANSLIEWAFGEHAKGNFETALSRYELILSTPLIEASTQDSLIEIRRYAINNQLTADMIVSRIKKHSTSSEKINEALKGHKQYPNDNRFIEVIDSSSRSLLKWATGKHQEQEYDIAQDRYELILSASQIDKSLVKETEIKLAYAKSQRRIPTSSTLMNQASLESHSSKKIEIFTEGYYLFPNDPRFKTELNNSAENLLVWATNQHQANKFDVAVDRYDLILSVPSLKYPIRKEVQIKNQYANVRERIPSAINLLSLASNEPHSSSRIKILNKGLYLYPEDHRFIVNINNSVESLLRWATDQHQTNDFDTAIDRYNLISEISVLDDLISKQVELKLSYANKQIKLPSENDILRRGRNENHSSKKIEILTEGYYLYPNSSRIYEELNQSADSLLNWAITQHQNRNFKTAIDRYELILETPQIKASTKDRVRNYLNLAKEKKTIIIPTSVVNGRVQNYSYRQMQQDIEKLEKMYPDLIQTKIIGTSVDRRNIYAIKLGNGKKEVFFNASFHAREHMTTNVLMKMIDDYALSYVNQSNYHGYNTKRILDEVSIWFVPMVNPDGVMLVQEGANSARNPSRVISINGGSRNFDSWKANIRGIDLNRQFPYKWSNVRSNDPGRPAFGYHKGVAPLTEPEARAVYNFTNRHNFKAALAYHSSGEVIFTRYGYDNHTRPATLGVSRITGYEPINLQHSQSGGGFTDWFVSNKRQIGMTMEISPYVPNRPVPLANWNKIWDENKTVGLYIANYVRNNR